GDLRIPNEPWARDLGFVSEEAKADLMRGAVALIQISNYESLSLVALEAWAQETPVLASKDCTVQMGHLARSEAGGAIGSYEDFAACLDSLWENPGDWQAKGRRGRAYVEQFFGDRRRFSSGVVAAIKDLSRPIRECMVERGIERARKYGRSKWRKEFGQAIESVLHAPKIRHRASLEITPRNPVFPIAAGGGAALIPIKIRNSGSLPALPRGKAGWQLRGQVISNDGMVEESPPEITPLPCLLVPNQEISAVLRVSVPPKAGSYMLRVATVQAD